MKTAMQELFEKFGHLLPNVEKEFIEKEKQQIINTYENATEDYIYNNPLRNGLEYYNEIFKIKL